MHNGQGWGHAANIPNVVPSTLTTGSILVETDRVLDRVLVLDEISQVQCRANESLYTALTRLTGHLDTILGSQPSKDGNTENVNAPSQGRVDRLMGAAHATSSLVALIHDQITRLERL